VFYETMLITAFEHACHWVHRDRKPDNILLSLRRDALGSNQASQKNKQKNKRYGFTREQMPTYVIKDCDFGLARTVPPAEPAAKVSSTARLCVDPLPDASALSLSQGQMGAPGSMFSPPPKPHGNAPKPC
jgi:serine/threonine protein kinase